MVLTAAQTTAFFENADQMDIPHVTVVQLGLKALLLLGIWWISTRIHCNNLQTTYENLVDGLQIQILQLQPEK